MNWSVIFEPDTLALYGQGLVVTLQLTLYSLGLGAVLALVCALALVSPRVWLRWPAQTFTYFMRGTPLLIQVYLIYYGVAQLEWVQARWDAVWPWTQFKEPFFCTLLSFSLNTAAYTAETLAGSIRETNKGEVEAARAMGMGHGMLMRRIVLPSAIRRMLPPLANEFITLLKDSSLLSAIAVAELAYVQRTISGRYSIYEEPLYTIALIYLVMTIGLSWLFSWLEKRYSISRR